jgi:hypothetical protein
LIEFEIIPESVASTSDKLILNGATKGLVW